MRTLLTTLALALAMLIPASAIAGGCSGFSCENACPLAKSANQRRATGTESVTVSVDLRQEVATTVLANLKKI
jgi:hypothetical protein